MKLTHALSALPFLGILVGISFANRTEPFVLGLPFALFWITLWVLLTAAIMVIGYALVTQLLPALVLALAKPGWVTKQGAMAGIVAGVAMVATMSFVGATPETPSSVESFIPGLPSFIAQLNLAIVALVVNLVVMIAVSAVTRTTAATPASGRFQRAEPAPVSSRS